MHDLNYFREHIERFEQMARHRGIELDLAGFRELDRSRREFDYGRRASQSGTQQGK